MLQITNVSIESCSPRLIFRWENNFQEGPFKFGLKKYCELWKFPILDSSDSKSLTGYQNILWIWLLGCKNLLNFAWHSMKFHNCHHASKELLENTSWFHNYPGSAFSGATAVVTTTCVQQGFLAIFPDFFKNEHSVL